MLSGHPQSDGTFTFTVAAEDSGGYVGERDYLLTVQGPSPSQDSSRIAFRSDRTGNKEVWVMSADGSNLANLTNHPDGDFVPAWEP